MIKSYNNSLDKNNYLKKKNYLWKSRGVIFKNIEDKEYWSNRYYNSINCELCDKPYKSTKDRHLEHSHITGEPRNICCLSCNAKKYDRKNHNKFSKNIYYDHKANIFVFSKNMKDIRITRKNINLNKLKWIKLSILIFNKKLLFT
jgi:hypothetical protein